MAAVVHAGHATEDNRRERSVRRVRAWTVHVAAVSPALDAVTVTSTRKSSGAR